MPGQIEHFSLHGQAALRLRTRSGASAVLSLFGGQLLSWQPAGGRERLYLSERACFDGRSALRGGVPVCFPQFAAQGPLPRHGFARNTLWTVRQERCEDDYALVVLALEASPQTRALWPHDFALELSIAIEGSRLDLELEVINRDLQTFAFQAALHTYLRVDEVEHCRLEGLYGFDYTDALQAGARKRDSGDALVVEGPVDRIYHDVDRALLLRQDAGALGIHADGFADVVVWNPWEEGCAAIADMAAADFRRMLCVEAAAVQPVELPAGATWVGRQTLVTL